VLLVEDTPPAKLLNWQDLDVLTFKIKSTIQGNIDARIANTRKPRNEMKGECGGDGFGLG